MSKSTNKPGFDFWIIGIVALIWNLMGVFAYLKQAYLTEEDLMAMPVAEQALYQNIPAWVTGAYAIAVFGGALGCILLLLRKKLAGSLFLISLIAIAVQMSYNIFMSKATEVYGPGGITMTAMIILIGVFLLWYAKKKTAAGVLT